MQESITITSGGPAAPGTSGRPPVVSDAARQRAQEYRLQRQQQCQARGEDAVGGRIVPPVKLVDVLPIYPETAKANGIVGTVTLDAVIGLDGTVKDVTTVSSPHPDLERAATEAVQQWEFSTATLNCTPVELSMRVILTFKEL